MREFGYELPPNSKVPSKVQELARQATLDHHEARSAQNEAKAAGLKESGLEYANEVRSTVGTKELERLRSSRSTDVKLELSDTIADRITQLKDLHIKKARAIHEKNQLATPHAAILCAPPPCQEASDDWAIYSPPYPGSFWSFDWNVSDEPDDPVLARILDQSDGRIGSSIHTRLTGADNDDFLNADYYTAFKLWHRVPKDGHLEAYLTFRFNNLNYALTTNNERGFSSYISSQFTGCHLRILAPDGTWEIKPRTIHNLLKGNRKTYVSVDSEWLFPPNDIHWFYFKSDTSYTAGSWVLLEAAVQNAVWFNADDYSIATINDADLSLDRIAVRSV